MTGSISACCKVLAAHCTGHPSIATIRSASFPDLTIPLMCAPTPARQKNPASLAFASSKAAWFAIWPTFEAPEQATTRTSEEPHRHFFFSSMNQASFLQHSLDLFYGGSPAYHFR